MSKPKLSAAEQKEKIKEQSRIRQAYSKRITVAKNGREAFGKNDYVNAIKNYHTYLKTIAEAHDRDVYTITPDLFQKKDVAELLLLSHVYWDMSRIYEMNPQMQQSFLKCLQQFVRFTVNQPYQVVNAEMLRKYIKKNKHKSKQIGNLEKAYGQIFTQSKKCYIATYCYGENSQEVRALRNFKDTLANNKLGQKFIQTYYFYSSWFVNYLESKHKPVLHFSSKLLIKIGLFFILKILFMLKFSNVSSRQNNL